MKKGELRREAIIRTAERLFFEKGYEETSIQDILDELSISKGGFYHHFDSKIALLSEICRQRGERDLERVRGELENEKLRSAQKLSLLLGCLHLFGNADPAFTALVLKVSYLDGDVNFRDQMRTFNISGASFRRSRRTIWISRAASSDSRRFVKIPTSTPCR